MMDIVVEQIALLRSQMSDDVGPVRALHAGIEVDADE